ncbi:MAG: hypothetical protein C0469_13785 [Cyanobacteria bacterium DS2.3.42]|nr:hypothetical protein [Cyanobacteria bacterium DS2.3.42]
MFSRKTTFAWKKILSGPANLVIGVYPESLDNAPKLVVAHCMRLFFGQRMQCAATPERFET